MDEETAAISARLRADGIAGCDDEAVLTLLADAVFACSMEDFAGEFAPPFPSLLLLPEDHEEGETVTALTLVDIYGLMGVLDHR